jgi:hypothetical protein
LSTLDQIILEVIKLALAGIAGGLIGAKANDKLARSRDRESGIANRRREFLVFMRAWRKEVDMAYNDHEAIYKIPGLFGSTIAGFCASAETIRCDYTKGRRKEIESRIGAISSFSPHQNSRDKYEPFIKAIDEIIAYVDAV